jgi:hypothetical protein
MTRFLILLESQQTPTRFGLLVRVASNLMDRRSYWAPGSGNICGIVSLLFTLDILFDGSYYSFSVNIVYFLL